MRSYLRVVRTLGALLAIFTLLVGVGQQPHPARGAAKAPAVAMGATTFVNVIPSSDGTALFVEAGDASVIATDTLFTSISIGPGGNKRSYAMDLSKTLGFHYATVAGFSPGVNYEGVLAITSTLGLNTGDLSYRRAFIPQGEGIQLRSDDGAFEVEIVNPETLSSDNYLAITPSNAPPGAPLPDHRIIGNVYSARISEPQPVVGRAYYFVRFFYDPQQLPGVDLRSLGVFAWNSSTRSWRLVESVLLDTIGYLSAADQRFTTYALMAMPTWIDEFDSASGSDLQRSNNILISRGGATLRNRPGEGTLWSHPISLPPGVASWGELSYTSSGGRVRVDVLRPDGSPLLLDLPSGASLAELSVEQHQTLVLRATLSEATADGAPPFIERWGVSWRLAKPDYQVALPLMRN